MIDYTMPVLSEQEKAYQIEMCESEIERLEITLKSGSSDTPHHVKSALVRQKIALAALTAKTIGYTYCGLDLYTAPPVPVKQEGEK